MEQLLVEAQHRWLRPAEICEILRNYKKFRIAPQPANMPPSGSLFLFDRKVLRYFRKDGHNWRKKKDGKTVKEAHERLKAGSIDVLHCYYAHGEEDENFQRRSYWMLEEELSHIVLVHYREVKGNRTNFNRMKETEEAIPYPQETEDILPSSEIDSSMASSFPSNSYGVPSQTTDTTSLYSAQASDYEDAESAYNHQASSAFHSYLESQQPMVEKINAGLTDHYFPASSSSKLLAIANLDFVFLTQVDEVKDGNNTGLKNLDFVLWEDVLENGASDGQALEFQSSFLETQPHTIGILPKQENEILGQLFTSNFERQELGGHPKVQEGWQTSGCKWSLDQNAHTESTHGVTSRFHEQDVIRVNLLNSLDPGSSDKLENHPMQDNPKVRLLNVDHGYFLKSDQESKATLEGKSNYSFALKPPLLDGSLREESLKKVDSFNRWMSKELGDVNESHMQSSSGTYWDSVESESRVEVSEKDYSLEKAQEKLLEKLLKEKLYVWLLQKAAEGGKGPSILDKGGQGVLHFAAALGYDWALQPTIVAGVSVNFRDVNGWTALHWAAFCGRERTVASLVSLGAAPGALTDPCISYPSGRTPADLASINGHKGIAGYLAESALNAHLESLTLDTKEGDAAEISGAKAVQIVSERSATPVSNGELPDGLSMKDSLAALCNASQAAARIHQVFRVQSFQKKQLKEYCDDRFGMSNEQALSFYAVKTYKSGQHDLPVQAAAIRIQNKFRCWKGRKDYLITRQRIVKIQAHVRGHQVRKNYKKITWSVGILEKVILRWRRKGSGLRGFRSEARTDVCRMQDTSSNEDDYDFLKEGRKQTEERLKKALARVKSMVQYPEARDQYSRLLNVVAEIQETKVYEGGLNSSEEMTDFDDNELIDLDALLDEDAHMPPAM
ncbi:Calmodulin-binding transcription activator 3 [Morella rubra]|uniref:Calmodulin-binding transcription activator 3 n=1 Tax=Morella rubra TaxID=262757 RepID=A0A6A1VCL0_9ROSI|nr:Calmodulin-binding transcription activator 3 [Morella rubra]